jgi:lysophospholipase L1-like esterase
LKRLLILLTCLFFLPGCSGGGGGDDQKAPTSYTAVIFGDSIALEIGQSGELTTLTAPYGTWINKGVGGNTVTEGWNRWATDVDAINPKILVVSAGITDLHSLDPNMERIKRDLSNIVNQITLKEYKAYFLNYPEFATATPSQINNIITMNQWLNDHATQNIKIINYNQWVKNNSSYMYSNLIHPTAAGYVELAKYIYNNF